MNGAANRHHTDTRRAINARQDVAPAQPLDPQSVGRAAADYARRGYGVFPVNSSTKLPRFRKGAHPRWAPNPAGAAGHLLAAWDVDDVERHWPMARGTGVGLVPPAGAAFLDLDEKHAPGVVDFVRMTWPAIFANGEHRTRSGGAHVPVTVPAELKLGQSVDAELGIDVRLGLKGYVVAPPTTGYGVVRAFLSAASLAPIPHALAELLSPPGQPQRPVAAPPPPAGSDRRKRYVWAAVQGEHDAVAAAPKGARNATLHRSAVKLGSLVGAGVLAEVDAHDALLAGTQAAAEPLARHEADSTIRRGLEYGIRHPRQLEDGAA